MPLLWNALQWWKIQVLIPPSLCWGQLSQMYIAFLEEPVFTGASPLDYPCNLGHLEIIPVIEGISKACFNFAEFDSGGSTEIAPCLCLAQFWYFFFSSASPWALSLIASDTHYISHNTLHVIISLLQRLTCDNFEESGDQRRMPGTAAERLTWACHAQQSQHLEAVESIEGDQIGWVR